MAGAEAVAVFDGRSATGAGDNAELDALEAWLDAHTWLDSLTEIGERQVQLFGGVLGDSLADDDEILVALLALAHAPSAAAKRMLEDYAKAPHPGFEHLARLALEEWEFWAERTSAGRVA